MINTLFIDLDGTLLDTKTASKTLFDNLADRYLGDRDLGKSLKKSFRKNCNDVFYTLPHADYLENIGWCRDWESMFYSDFIGEDSRLIDLKKVAEEYQHAVLGLILSEYGKADRTLIKSIIAFIQENWVEYYHPYLDAYDFLAACKGFKKYILTNGLVDIQMKKIQHCGLYEKVDGVFISGMLAVGKPAVDYFDHVLNATDIDKKSAIMIGDSLSSDIMGAANAGIKTIWKRNINNSNEIQNINPNAIINNLMEVPKLLPLI